MSIACRFGTMCKPCMLLYSTLVAKSQYLRAKRSASNIHQLIWAITSESTAIPYLPSINLTTSTTIPIKMHFELLLLICFVSLSSSAPTATPSRSTGEPLCRHNYSQWLQITSLQSQLASHSDGRLHVSQLSRRDITDLHVFFLETIQSVHFLMALIVSWSVYMHVWH